MPDTASSLQSQVGSNEDIFYGQANYTTLVAQSLGLSRPFFLDLFGRVSMPLLVSAVFATRFHSAVKVSIQQSDWPEILVGHTQHHLCFISCIWFILQSDFNCRFWDHLLCRQLWLAGSRVAQAASFILNKDSCLTWWMFQALSTYISINLSLLSLIVLWSPPGEIWLQEEVGHPLHSVVSTTAY